MHIDTNQRLSRSQLRRAELLLVAVLVGSGVPGQAAPAMPLPRAPAPEGVSLEALNLAGVKALRANKDRKSWVLVNFWATWCGPCITEFPDLLDLERDYAQRGFELVTVAAQSEDERNQVLAFLTKQGARGRNYLLADADKEAALTTFDKAWEGGLPFTLLLSPKGKVLYRQQGPVDVAKVRTLLDKGLSKVAR